MSPQIVFNPYAGVDWRREQYRANLHTHTTVTDGCFHPHQAVDIYSWGRNPYCAQCHVRASCGYTGEEVEGARILAITDHSQTATPWREFSTDTRRFPYRGPCLDESRQDRDPQALGMISILGNELSRLEHILTLYCSVQDYEGSTYDSSLEAVERAGGISIWSHPGRYRGAHEWKFYLDYYVKYPSLMGQEVFNCGDTGTQNRELWDEILSRLMPERPVYGFSNDDSHLGENLFRNYNMILTSEFTDAGIRRAIDQGNFYFSYAPQGRAPKITEIQVDDSTISISGQGICEIQWISGGAVVATGSSINLQETPGVNRYLRAVLLGESQGETHTQAFGIK